MVVGHINQIIFQLIELLHLLKGYWYFFRNTEQSYLLSTCLSLMASGQEGRKHTLVGEKFVKNGNAMHMIFRPCYLNCHWLAFRTMSMELAAVKS